MIDPETKRSKRKARPVLVFNEGIIDPRCLNQLICCHISISRSQYNFTLRSDLIPIEPLDQGWLVGKQLLYVPKTTGQRVVVEIIELTTPGENCRELRCLVDEQAASSLRVGQIAYIPGLYLLKGNKVQVNIPISRHRPKRP